MVRKKSYKNDEPVIVVSTVSVDTQDGGAVIHIGDNASGRTNSDLTDWLGKGIDDWVWAVVAQLRALVHSKTVTGATIANYCSPGIQAFFTFLTQNKIITLPGELHRQVVVSYVAWLKTQPQWGYLSQKSVYTATKSVLVAMQKRGLVPLNKDLFPANPFPKSNSKGKGGETALSPGERLRLVQAMREDIILFHKGDYPGTESEGLVVHVLALAIRTGANTTPLLELGRDNLKPHPWIASMRILKTFKRRGNATNLKSLRYSQSDEAPVTVPMDGVALLSLILQRNQALVEIAPENKRNRVWLYRDGRSTEAGKVKCLSASTLGRGIQNFLVRHQLKDDAGAPLTVNLQRLRKTMDNRLFDLSDGDLIATSAIMGRTPQITEKNYLACTEDMRRNATFVGEALPDIYDRGLDGDPPISSKVIPIVPLENTPVGSCKDSLTGDKAPKDGTHCFDFFSCVTCKSYAIVGAPKDLHRLFSFYWFVKAELEHARSQDWREKFASTMTLIDAFTRDKFDAKLVAQAKELARLQPLKFWKAYQAGRGDVGQGVA